MILIAKKCRFLACLLGLLGAAQVWAQPVQVTDDRQQVHRFAQPPQRIVSLLPSLTESVCALGQCHRLVGRDRYSNFPASVRGLPAVGGGLDPGVEAIVALRPDVVLIAGSAVRPLAQMQALGLAVVVLEPKTHADVQRVLITLGQLLAVPEAVGAGRLWRSIQAETTAAALALSPKAKQARVFFEVGNGPYAAGEASFIGETLQKMGVKNIVPAALGPFPKLNPEFVVQANPDVLMGSVRTVAAPPYPGWEAIRAVRERRICAFSPGQNDVLVRAGPRMAEAARIMAACLEKVAPELAPAALK